MKRIACVAPLLLLSYTVSAQDNSQDPSLSEPDSQAEPTPDPTPSPYAFNNLEATGDLTKPVTEDTTCLATGAAPVAFTSQAPQFCLITSSAQRERCCTPSHDVFIKDHVAGLWPTDCAHEEYPGLNELACLICSQD